MPIADSNKRVYITLPKEVVEKLEIMAERDMRSLASMTALMVVRGLEAVEKESQRNRKEGGK